MNILPGFLRLLSTLLAGGLLAVLPASVFGQPRVGTEPDLLRRADIRGQLGLTDTQTQEIELSVTMIALDSSVDVPDVIESPLEFVAALRGQQGVRWSERFRLSTLDKRSAKMSIGNVQAVTSGYTMQPGFRRPPDAASPNGPPGGATAPRSGFGTARSPVRASPNIVQEVFGTSVALQPSIQEDGRILIEATLSSSRPDEVTESTKETDEDLVPKSFTRKLSVTTTISAASGKSVLLRTLESDATGKLPAQTVLVVITATVGG